jgi:hypothetical protein
VRAVCDLLEGTVHMRNVGNVILLENVIGAGLCRHAQRSSPTHFVFEGWAERGRTELDSGM